MNPVIIALSWFGTVAYYTCFLLIILAFHPLQALTRRIGYTAHKRCVDLMIWFMNKTIFLMGMRLAVNGKIDLPLNRPLIVVSNHQSLHDICIISYVFAKHHPKWVSKIELGRGIPSISYNLRHGGSVLIDRKDRRQAITALRRFSEYIRDNNYCACIFPEGTRARDGEMKSFKPAGVLSLAKQIPEALIVPVALTNTCKTFPHKGKPAIFGTVLKADILPAIDAKDLKCEDDIKSLEDQIRAVAVKAS